MNEMGVESLPDLLRAATDDAERLLPQWAAGRWMRSFFMRE
jgi:hypothetical protein